MVVRLIYVTLCFWGMYESAYGLMQVAGLRFSSHPLFAMTGHFQNPGPYGGFIAVITAMAAVYIIRYRKRYKGIYRGTMMVISALTLILGMLVLPASMSRAGWAAFLVAVAIGLLTEEKIRMRLRKHRSMTAVACVIALLLCIGAFLLKKDSAIGRLHIWHIECLAISENPISGNGNGMGAYGSAQEAFFRKHLDEVPETIVRVAGCPEYPFNEYLGIGMNAGLPAMLLCVALTVTAAVILWRRKSLLAAGFTALALFACFSYPMSLAQFRILLPALLLGCVPSVRRRNLWKAATYYTIILLFGAFLLISAKTADKDFRTLYNEGYALHLARQYEESNKVLRQGAEISSDPMFDIIVGKNLEALGDYSEAEESYWKAYYTVPCRIYPLIRLMRLHIRQGQDANAIEIAKRIGRMPVNEKNPAMARLRDEAMYSLDSLKTVCQENY